MFQQLCSLLFLQMHHHLLCLFDFVFERFVPSRGRAQGLEGHSEVVVVVVGFSPLAAVAAATRRFEEQQRRDVLGPRLRQKVPQRRCRRGRVRGGWIDTAAAASAAVDLFRGDCEALLSEPRDCVGEGQRRRRRRRRRFLASFSSFTSSSSSNLVDRTVQPPGRERVGCPRGELRRQSKRGERPGARRRSKHRGLPAGQRRERVALLEDVKGGDGGGGSGGGRGRGRGRARFAAAAAPRRRGEERRGGD